MKNLEFRYYDEVTKQMVYSSEFDWPNEFNRLSRFFLKAMNYAENGVQQSTGLLDKNGVKIFEGDILKADGYDADNNGYDFPAGEVAFDGGEFVLFTRDPSWPCAALACLDKKEVIGNVFENPELLKQ